MTPLVNAEATLSDIVRDTAPDASPLVVDGESVGDVCGYEWLIQELDGLLGGALRVTRVDCHEGSRRRLEIVRERATIIVCDVAGDTDLIDEEALVRQLNAVLAKEGNPLRLAAYCSSEFGQETAFVALSEKQCREIAGIVRARAEEEIFEDFTFGAS